MLSLKKRQIHCSLSILYMKKIFSFLAILTFIGAGCQNNTAPEEKLILNTEKPVYCSSEGKIVTTKQKQNFPSYCLVPIGQNTYTAGTPSEYRFEILTNEGTILTDFSVVHEKIMHVIALRSDATNFQHIHPEFNPTTGVFILKDLTFPQDGTYRLYFDFTPTQAVLGTGGNPLRTVLTHDVLVGIEKSSGATLTDFKTVQNVDKFKVTLKTDKPEIQSGEEHRFTFHVEEKTGKPIEHVEKYLGELGHLVIINEQTLDYIHAHPVQSITNIYNDIPFVVAFPQPGNYKLFLEFKYAGTVHKVEYGVQVNQGSESTSMDHMETMTH